MIHENAKGTGNGLDPNSCGWDCQCEYCADEDAPAFHCRKTDSLFEMSILRGDVDFCPGCGEPWKAPVLGKPIANPENP